MAETQDQIKLFEIEEVPGRPMLHWNGKRPLRSIPYYPAQEREVYGPREGGQDGWVNRLYWGDNLQVMAHLMREFRGKVNLIYIDPPFDSKADYRKRIRVRGQQVENDLSVLEEKQYTDVWANDLYLQFMYERLVLMRELLAENGTIVVHCDWNVQHLLRCVMDEVFLPDNFINEVIWQHAVIGAGRGIYRRLPKAHEMLLFYGRSAGYKFNTTHPFVRVPYKDRITKNLSHDEKGSYYTRGRTGTDNPWSKEPRYLRTYVDIDKGKLVHDVWDDITTYRAQGSEYTGYPTQKPEELIDRVIALSSDVGDIVLDCFIGSGTTAVAAQKLCRRWIGCDINLGAIHTTANRLTQIIENEESPQATLPETDEPRKLWPSFAVYNVNHYDVFKNALEAKEIVLKLYGVEAAKDRFFDGALDGKRIKVIDLNRICTRADIQMIFDNISPDDKQGVLVICSGSEYDITSFIKRKNITNIPFEVRDILTDRNDVIFKKPPEASLRIEVVGEKATLTIDQFYSPMLMQKLSLEEEPEQIEDWRQIVESVLVDQNYDGAVFHPTIIDQPDKADVVKGDYTWTITRAASVAVKIVDVLDEEYFEVLEVKR